MTQTWRTIVVDPPWQFDQAWNITKPDGYLVHSSHRGTRTRPKRGAAANYKLMTMQELTALPVGQWAPPENAHLYIWTTNSFLIEAHDLMRAWGFRQKTMLTWVKPRLGMGTYYRNCTEHVLFGVRPKSPVLRHDVKTFFCGEQGRHSEKPQAFYDIVESMSPGPRLDVFARRQRLGWDVAGDQVYSVIPALAADRDTVDLATL